MKNLIACFILITTFTLSLKADDTPPAITAEKEVELAFFYAARSGDMELLNTFVEAGVNLDYQNSEGYSALMVAAFRGQSGVIDVLLANNVNSCLRDKRGNTALMAAIVSAELSIARKLMGRECPDETTQQRTVEFATMFGRTEILKQLVNKK